MKFLGRSLAITAGLAGALANLAVARATPDGTEDAELTFAEATVEGDRVRLVAGEVDGRGVVHVEYYAGTRLRFAVPYTKALIDGQATSVRDLRSIVAGSLGTHGFAITADHGTARISCTVQLFADAVDCVRDPAWVPKGDPDCVAAFVGEVGRFQCSGLRTHFATTTRIAHEEVLRRCLAAFRHESNRVDCLRYGYNEPDVARFREGLAVCVAAYRTEDERKFCTFYEFANANPADRPAFHHIRTCDRRHDDDRATTDCVFELHTGTKQVHPKSRTLLPFQQETVPLARPLSLARVNGARIDVAGGTLRDLALRVTGGMVGDEPILWADAFTREGTLKWAQIVDRIVIGKQIRALRDLASLEHVKVADDVITFRATYGGKRLTCRVITSEMWGRCR